MQLYCMKNLAIFNAILTQKICPFIDLHKLIFSVKLSSCLHIICVWHEHIQFLEANFFLTLSISTVPSRQKQNIVRIIWIVCVFPVKKSIPSFSIENCRLYVCSLKCILFFLKIWLLFGNLYYFRLCVLE